MACQVRIQALIMIGPFPIEACLLSLAMGKMMCLLPAPIFGRFPTRSFSTGLFGSQQAKIEGNLDTSMDKIHPWIKVVVF
jgi:hypothetical protein